MMRCLTLDEFKLLRQPFILFLINQFTETLSSQFFFFYGIDQYSFNHEYIHPFCIMYCGVKIE